MEGSRGDLRHLNVLFDVTNAEKAVEGVAEE